MKLQLNQIFDAYGKPVPFARIDVYESGPDGKHLLGVRTDVNGVPPPVMLDSATGSVMVRVEVLRAGDEPLCSSHDLSALGQPGPDMLR